MIKHGLVPEEAAQPPFQAMQVALRLLPTFHDQKNPWGLPANKSPISPTLEGGLDGTGPQRSLGKRGKTPPCCESGSWVALRFLRCGKILNVSQRIHLRFFHIAKSEYQLEPPLSRYG